MYCTAQYCTVASPLSTLLHLCIARTIVPSHDAFIEMNETMEQSSSKAAATIETTFVGRTSIVHIPDGRAFCGTFVCVDSGKNIILANTDEIRLTLEGRTTTRNVGMVMIPGEYVVKVEVQQDALDHATAQPSLAPAGWPDDDLMYT